MKECLECKEEKELIEFYKHEEMADGHLNKCKQCVRERVNNHRKKNIERIKDYDRNRPNKKERVKKNLERIQRYKQENPKKYDDYNKSKNEWAKANRHKRNAQNKVQRALYNGKIVRPTKCQRCEETENLHGHHADYSKPLEVIWLCPSCHGAEHARINEEKRNTSNIK